MASSRARLAALCLAVLAAFRQYAAADKMTWAPCDEGLTAFTPTSVTLSPDPPVIGSAATFVITGNIDSEVQGGSVDMVVSFAGFPIYSSTSDLCTKTTCPVPAGPISLTLEQLLPPIAPPGDYGLQVIARGADSGELACVNVNFSLVMPSSSASSSSSSSGAAAAASTAAAAASALRNPHAGSGGFKAVLGLAGAARAGGGGEGQRQQAGALYRRSLRAGGGGQAAAR